MFKRLAHTLTMADRQRAGRQNCPTGCVVDAQRASSGGVGVASERDYDPARRVVGRKRYALADMDGRLLVTGVLPADLHGSYGAIALLRASRGLFLFLAHCFANCAYRGERVGTATTITVEIVEPKKGQEGLAVQPRRWVIERSFGWIGRCRRLARDLEATTPLALISFVHAAAMPLLRRMAQALRDGAYHRIEGRLRAPPRQSSDQFMKEDVRPPLVERQDLISLGFDPTRALIPPNGEASAGAQQPNLDTATPEK